MLETYITVAQCNGVLTEYALLSFSAVFLMMLPLFLVSSVLAYFLLREMQKEEKKSAKKGTYIHTVRVKKTRPSLPLPAPTLPYISSALHVNVG